MSFCSENPASKEEISQSKEVLALVKTVSVMREGDRSRLKEL